MSVRKFYVDENDLFDAVGETPDECTYVSFLDYQKIEKELNYLKKKQLIYDEIFDFVRKAAQQIESPNDQYYDEGINDGRIRLATDIIGMLPSKEEMEEWK